ncbi:MAG: M23 family metallopeptidase [Oscillospiraceae bacterium]|nr:M23 family metallopeptidase [Oscillospiraceae bacterium]
MPFKSKNNNARNNGSRKTESILKTIYKRYNPEKVTIKGLKNFFGMVFYKTGYDVEMVSLKLWKKISKVLLNVAADVFSVAKAVAVFFDKLTDTILDDLGEPLDRVGSAFAGISEIIKETKNDKSIKTGKLLKKYIREGLEKHKDLAKTLYSYVGPLVMAGIFCIVVGFTMSREYAIQVSLDGQDIGVINNYTVLKNADKIIKNKLVSTNEQTWELDSDIKMVSLGSKEVVNERQLANNILRASDEDIIEATGLYVDGEFIGAVKDPTLLNNALASMKAPYENGDPNRTVKFVQDVSVLDGIFFADTVVPDKELADLVVSEVSGAKYYTAVSGDNPWNIAKKNGITTSTLYALNPDNDFSGLWPGDVFVVGASVPFLQVQYVERTTRQVDIPYTVKEEKDKTMTLGTRKVAQAGVKGLKEELVESVYIDGVLQSETVVQSTVLSQPVQEIVKIGTYWNGTIIEGGSGKLTWPTAGGYVSRGFVGQYPAHNGVDIAGPYGTYILAADSGVVTKALYTNVGYGVYCIIEHGGYQTLYGHCSRLLVSVGQQVQKGQIIAYMGSTGNSTGNHLHFEVKRGNVRYNPYSWF